MKSSRQLTFHLPIALPILNSFISQPSLSVTQYAPLQLVQVHLLVESVKGSLLLGHLTTGFEAFKVPELRRRCVG